MFNGKCLWPASTLLAASLYVPAASPKLASPDFWAPLDICSSEVLLCTPLVPGLCGLSTHTDVVATARRKLLRQTAVLLVRTKDQATLLPFLSWLAVHLEGIEP